MSDWKDAEKELPRVGHWLAVAVMSKHVWGREETGPEIRIGRYAENSWHVLPKHADYSYRVLAWADVPDWLRERRRCVPC